MRKRLFAFEIITLYNNIYVYEFILTKFSFYINIIIYLYFRFVEPPATEPFAGSSVNQILKNAQEENKNKHISYNINTVFNNKDYLVRRFDLFYYYY